MLRKKFAHLCAVVTVAVWQIAPAWAAPTRLLGVYEEQAVQTCDGGNKHCTVFFSTLTKPLLVTQVSCSIFIAVQNPSIIDVTLGKASETKTKYLGAIHLAPANPSLFSASATQFGFLLTTQHVVPGSWRPAIDVIIDKAGEIVLDCSISGSESAQ